MILERRNFILNFILWALAFFFGYTIKKESEDKDLLITGPKSDVSNVEKNISTILSESVKQKTNYVNVKAFGADSSGEINSVSAFQDAVVYMKEKGIDVLYIPTGTYKIVAGNGTRLLLDKTTTILGDGDSSIIKFDDTPSISKTFAESALFRVDGVERIEFRNLQIQGSLFEYLATHGEKNSIPFFSIVNTKALIFENVTLYGSRTVCMQVENCSHVKATNCTVKYSIRDGIRLVNCSNVIATDNYFFNVSDDSITVTTIDTFTSGSGAVISNNVFEFSQGIRCLGSKIVDISNNVFKRCHYIGISVGYNVAAKGSEGHTPSTSINISNNTFSDFLKFSAANDGDRIIEINGANIKADSAGRVPSVTAPPYAYNYLAGASANGVPAFHGLRIHGNVFIRTLPNVPSVDTWGFGQLLDRTVSGKWINSAITDDSFAKVCIRFVGSVYDCIISENIISGTTESYGIWFYGLDATYSGINLNNIKLINNHFYDLTNVAVYFTTTYKKSNVVIEGNTFDVDPFFRNPYHNTDNSWNASGKSGTAIGGTDLKGVIMRNNTFANCYTPFTGTPTVSLNNYAFAQTGIDNDSNKGVYDLSKTTTILIDGVPTSPTFRQVL